MEFRDVVRHIRDAGHKLTPQRVEILRVLIAAAEPVSAQTVLERVKTIYPDVSLDTVYRSLSMLTGAGLVNQINLQVKSAALFEFQGEDHHHHAVCLICGRSFCVEVCPLAASLPPPAADVNFRVVSHAFELYGYCSGCRETKNGDEA